MFLYLCTLLASRACCAGKEAMEISELAAALCVSQIKLRLNVLEKLPLTLVVLVLSCYQEGGKKKKKVYWSTNRFFLKANLILWAAEHLLLYEKCSPFLLDSVGALVLSLGQVGASLYFSISSPAVCNTFLGLFEFSDYTVYRDPLRGECEIVLPCTFWAPFIFPNIY